MKQVDSSEVKDQRNYAVLTTGGEHVFESSDFRIQYSVRGEPPIPVEIWRTTKDQAVSLCLLNSPSGSGKTTFITNLFHYLQCQPTSLSFDFRPDHVSPEECAYGYIPQQPPFGNHWRVSNLLPPDSEFVTALFPDVDITGIRSKRIGEFSGGQKSRIYVCSALERMRLLSQEAAFLVLDEIFDGLGAQEAHRCLRDIRGVWERTCLCPLYILLVSHLDQFEIAPKDMAPTRLSLEVQDETYESLSVHIENK